MKLLNFYSHIRHREMLPVAVTRVFKKTHMSISEKNPQKLPVISLLTGWQDVFGEPQ